MKTWKQICISQLTALLFIGCGGSGGSNGETTNDSDTNPPELSNPVPAASTVLPSDTTSTILGVTTDESAECRYATQANTDYGNMSDSFTTTGETSHSTSINGLTIGSSYNYYVRCRDRAGNFNTSDYMVSVSIATEGNGNQSPVLDTITDITVTEGETVTLNPSANDPDNDSLEYTYTGWMITSSYITRTGDAGTYTVTVTVDDGNGGIDSQDVTINVLPASSNPVQKIAYVSPSTTSQEIRTINPNGTDDSLLWRTPVTTHPDDSIALGGLSWRPDGSELAFDSGHDWQRSMSVRDLYAISSNGQNLRRISRPPHPDDYEQYPKGTVKFVLDMIEQGDVQLYIEGMDEPYTYFANLNDTWSFTITLADMGDNYRQLIRVWDPDETFSTCNFSEEGWVDVIPNTETDLGTIHFGANSDLSCPVLFGPSWNHDGGAINYLFEEPDQTYPENNPWQIVEPIGQISVGTRLLDFNNYVSRGKPYRIVSGPTQETADDIFFLENIALNDAIYYATASNAADHRRLDLGLCPQTTCDILDIEYLPDGTGLIFSRYETGLDSTSAVIYQYIFSSNQFQEIIRLPNEGIGNLSVSPDGNKIVFERAPSLYDGVSVVRYGPRLLCPCELWIVNLDGSNLYRLTEDGRQPAWGPGVTAQ